MLKLNFSYVNKRIRYGLGMTLMACSLVACTPNGNEKNEYDIVSEMDDAIELSAGGVLHHFENEKIPTELDSGFDSELAENRAIMQAGEDKIVIQVEDESDFIIGMELAVRDSLGNVVDKFITTNKAHILTNVTPGETYYLEEINVPEDYEKEEKLYKFTIPSWENSLFQLAPEYYNYYKVNRVRLYKTSKNKKDVNNPCYIKVAAMKSNYYDSFNMTDVKFEISDVEGNVIETFISSEEQHYFYAPEGTYKIKIVDMLEGYELECACQFYDTNDARMVATNECEITVNKDDPSTGVYFILTNEKSKSLTKTR